MCHGHEQRPWRGGKIFDKGRAQPEVVVLQGGDGGSTHDVRVAIVLLACVFTHVLPARELLAGEHDVDLDLVRCLELLVVSVCNLVKDCVCACYEGFLDEVNGRVIEHPHTLVSVDTHGKEGVVVCVFAE